MKIPIYAILICTAIILSGCTQPNTITTYTSFGEFTRETVPTNITTNESCIAHGGSWRDISNALLPKDLPRHFACIFSYRDANKSCTDGSQCESHFCSAPNGNSNIGDAITGTCYPYNIYIADCGFLVQNGTYAGGWCV